MRFTFPKDEPFAQDPCPVKSSWSKSLTLHFRVHSANPEPRRWFQKKSPENFPSGSCRIRRRRWSKRLCSTTSRRSGRSGSRPTRWRPSCSMAAGAGSRTRSTPTTRDQYLKTFWAVLTNRWCHIQIDCDFITLYTPDLAKGNNQCYQIGDFWKFLVIWFLSKVAQMHGEFLG